MTRITAIVRPHKLEQVKAAVADLGISGMSVSEVRGRGNSPEAPVLFGNREVQIVLSLKARLMIVVPDELVETIVEAILANAATGEGGDGKVFLEPVADALRIRTEERGDSAI